MKMIKDLTTALTSLLVVGAIAGSPEAWADVYLGNVTTADANSISSVGGGDNTTYNGYGNTWGLFLATGGVSSSPSFLNTTDTVSNLNLDLTLGEHTYTGYFITSYEAVGVALFFGNSSAPGLEFYSAESAPSTPVQTWANEVTAVGGGRYSANPDPSTTWTDGTDTVSLTSARFTDWNTLQTILPAGVDYHTPMGSGAQTQAVTFTLDVTSTVGETSVPEPLSALLMLPGIGGLIIARRRRRAALA